MKAKKILFRLLRDRIMECTACRLSESSGKNAFGIGSIDAKLMIVGGWPGAAEDASDEPFAGEAGKKLYSILKYYKLSKEDVFITNAVCCSTPENRYPLYEEEVAICRHRLGCQISIIKPTLIVGLGPIAAQALLGYDLYKEAGNLSALFNKMHMIDIDNDKFPVIMSYHPLYLLEHSDDGSVKAKAKTHWDRAMGFLDIENS